MDFGKIGEELFGDISEKFDSFCSGVDEAINCKLSAVGAQIKGFWSEIVQDNIPKSPKNIVDVEEEGVTNCSNSRMPTVIVDDEKNNNDTCPIPKVIPMVPDEPLQKESSLEENEAMGMYNNSNATDTEICTDEAKISSLESFESIFGSCIKWDTSRHVDRNTVGASDRQADDSVPKLSNQGVESDDILSMLSLGNSGTEDALDLEDYEKGEEIRDREWSSVGANGPLVTKEFMYATQSQFDYPELYEDYFVVIPGEKSSIPSLEKNNGTSTSTSVEIKKNKHLEDQEQVKSFAPTLPPADSVVQDGEISDDDWVVI